MTQTATTAEPPPPPARRRAALMFARLPDPGLHRWHVVGADGYSCCGVRGAWVEKDEAEAVRRSATCSKCWAEWAGVKA